MKSLLDVDYNFFGQGLQKNNRYRRRLQVSPAKSHEPERQLTKKEFYYQLLNQSNNKDNLFEHITVIIQKPTDKRTRDELVFMTKACIQINPFFYQIADCYGQDFIYELCQKLEYSIKNPEEVIIKKGELPTKMWILLKGAVQISEDTDSRGNQQKDADDYEINAGQVGFDQLMDKIKVGGQIGAQSILSNQQAQVSYVVREISEFAIIDSALFSQMLEEGKQRNEKIQYLTQQIEYDARQRQKLDFLF